MQVISRGMRNRRIGSHELNLESSRSHSIVTVHCTTSAGDDNDSCTRFGKVQFDIRYAMPGFKRGSRHGMYAEVPDHCSSFMKEMLTWCVNRNAHICRSALWTWLAVSV